MAMIVNSGTTVDPVTGREVKGKERMVFNYKSLNDNTYKDQYSLPGINTIIKRIGGAKISHKFGSQIWVHHKLLWDENQSLGLLLLVPGDYSMNGWQDSGVVIVLQGNRLGRLELNLTKRLTVDFLGAVIGEGTIKLQPHIIKKIVNFNEEELKTKKGLRSFLGILNYARSHIQLFTQWRKF
ncbi:hypothetical protein Tco_1394151 [Tanacetum coccineum]